MCAISGICPRSDKFVSLELLSSPVECAGIDDSEFPFCEINILDFGLIYGLSVCIPVREAYRHVLLVPLRGPVLVKTHEPDPRHRSRASTAQGAARSIYFLISTALTAAESPHRSSGCRDPSLLARDVNCRSVRLNLSVGRWIGNYNQIDEINETCVVDRKRQKVKLLKG